MARTTWVDGETPVNAVNMNNIENRIEENTNRVTELKNNTLPIYLNQKGSIKSFYKTGIYHGTFTDLPPQLPSTFADGQGVVEVRNYSGETDVAWLEITFKSAHDMSAEYKIHKANTAWSDWKQVAVTEKIPFSCTAGVGFAITAQDCFTMNGMAYINVRVKKTDNTSIEAGQHFLVSNPYVPINRATVSYTLFSNSNIESALLQTPFSVNCSVWDSNVYAVFGGNTAGSIQIFAQFKI